MRNPLIYYRIANSLYSKGIPFFPNFITCMIRLVFSCYLPHTAQIARDVVLGYGGLGIVIHNRAIIASGCHIDQNVTIGGTTKKHQVPILGEKVYVGAGAVILGPVKIGNNVVIGANAVVLSDIPDNSVAVGVPARVIKSGIQIADYL